MDLLKQAPAKEVKSQNRDGDFVDAPSVNLKVVPCGSGGRYECQDGQTCCPQPSGGYGCCVPDYVSMQYSLNNENIPGKS